MPLLLMVQMVATSSAIMVGRDTRMYCWTVVSSDHAHYSNLINSEYLLRGLQ